MRASEGAERRGLNRRSCVHGFSRVMMRCICLSSGVTARMQSPPTTSSGRPRFESPKAGPLLLRKKRDKVQMLNVTRTWRCWIPTGWDILSLSPRRAAFRVSSRRRASSTARLDTCRSRKLSRQVLRAVASAKRDLSVNWWPSWQVEETVRVWHDRGGLARDFDDKRG
jgi:hypothetical protein